MNSQEDAHDFMSELPPLSEDEHAQRMLVTFSAFIETLDIKTLDYLRELFIQNYSSDRQQAELLDLLDGERLFRASDCK